jgi:hypothetical protein
MSMSKFATQADYWKDRAEKADETNKQLESDLRMACLLLRRANPDNRQWMEQRDSFLDSMGEFVEPKE